MPEYSRFCGIDVSLATLAVAVLQPDGRCQHSTCGNTATAHRQLARQLSAGPGPVLVVLEATSTYGLDLALALHATPGLTVALLNPRAAHCFAGAAMRRAKTDPLDAAGLALLGQRLRPAAWQPPSELALQLRDLGRRLAELVQLNKDEKNRLHAASQSRTGAAKLVSLQRTLAWLDSEIRRVEAEALALLERDPRLAEDFRLLDTAPGIARRSALQLLGEFACLPPGLEPQQWVALAGLDPRPVESGSSLCAPRHISRRGTPHIRATLFMCILSTIRCDPGAQRRYADLVGRGKPKRVAHCALMRKMIHALWAMLTYRRPWNSDRFAPHCP